MPFLKEIMADKLENMVVFLKIVIIIENIVKNMVHMLLNISESESSSFSHTDTHTFKFPTYKLEEGEEQRNKKELMI